MASCQHWFIVLFLLLLQIIRNSGEIHLDSVVRNYLGGMTGGFEDIAGDGNFGIVKRKLFPKLRRSTTNQNRDDVNMDFQESSCNQLEKHLCSVTCREIREVAIGQCRKLMTNANRSQSESFCICVWRWLAFLVPMPNMDLNKPDLEAE